MTSTASSAGRDLIAYDANSPLRLSLEKTGSLTPINSLTPQQNELQIGETGDIQISGPGTIEVLAGI